MNDRRISNLQWAYRWKGRGAAVCSWKCQRASEKDPKQTAHVARCWLPEEEAQVIALRKQGYTYAAIGEKIKRPRCSVGTKIKELKARGLL